MKRALLFLALSASLFGQVQAQLMSWQTHAAAGYTGPGDLGITGIKAWWGLRCYSDILASG